MSESIGATLGIDRDPSGREKSQKPNRALFHSSQRIKYLNFLLQNQFFNNKATEPSIYL